MQGQIIAKKPPVRILDLGANTDVWGVMQKHSWLRWEWTSSSFLRWRGVCLSWGNTALCLLCVPQHLGVCTDTEVLWLGNYCLSSADAEAMRSHCNFPALLSYIAYIKPEMFLPRFGEWKASFRSENDHFGVQQFVPNWNVFLGCYITANSFSWFSFLGICVPRQAVISGVWLYGSCTL